MCRASDWSTSQVCTDVVPRLCPEVTIISFSEARGRSPDNDVSVGTQSSAYSKRNMKLIRSCVAVRDWRTGTARRAWRHQTHWRSSGFHYFTSRAMWEMWFSFPSLWLFNFAVSNQPFFSSSPGWMVSASVLACFHADNMWGWFQD